MCCLAAFPRSPPLIILRLYWATYLKTRWQKFGRVLNMKISGNSIKLKDRQKAAGDAGSNGACDG